MAIAKSCVAFLFLLTSGALLIGTFAVMYRGNCPCCGGITLSASAVSALSEKPARQCLMCGRISCHNTVAARPQ
jgi:hypothetical protein